MKFYELCIGVICISIFALLIDRLFAVIGVPQANRKMRFDGSTVAHTVTVVFLASCACVGLGVLI